MSEDYDNADDDNDDDDDNCWCYQDVLSVHKKDWYKHMYNALHRPAHEPS